jgi:SPP1 gp7 family putative phage head morphogenesis protein
MYRYLDSVLSATKKKIRTEFNHLGSMGFDELNVANTRKITLAMFERLITANKEAYLKIAKKAYSAAKGPESVDSNFIDDVLLAYNLVTGYLYKNEAERKRLRLNEQILTAREHADGNMYRESLRKTANLWYTQTAQYGVDIVDAATLKAYRDRGIKYVKWIAQDDGRECADCGGRSGKVYKISDIPSKTHYGCRCYLIPAEKE